eukprot:c27615_g2_i1 orf=280-1509(+)
MLSKQRSAIAGPPPCGTHTEPPSLHVSVSDPVKLGNGVQAYISYRVSTKTNIPEYRGPEKVVIRRYSDFVWLYDCLAKKNKGIFIPPLPEKSAVEKFRFSAEFVELRRRALDVFINRIGSHPQLRHSEDLRKFLEADEEVWAMERARSQEVSLFGRKPSDFMQLFKEVQAKVSDAVLGKDKPIEESDPNYEKMKHYIFELEEHLSEVHKQSFRLVKCHRDLSESVSGFGKSVTALGSCEERNLGLALAEIGSQSDLISCTLHKQAEELLVKFEEPIKEYVRTAASIKNTVADRAHAFRQQRELVEVAKLKEINLQKLRVVQPEKVFEAEVDFKESRAQSEAARKHFETIVKLMQQEMARFQEEKTHDLGTTFHDFSRAQARLANDIANAWRSLVPKLENCSQQKFITSK